MNAADFEQLKKLLTGFEPPGLGPGPRPGVRRQAELEAELAAIPLPPNAGEMVRAAVLLWHDHHDAAHAIVQDQSGADAAFVHGILHRREPDYGNAAYWFRRVGRHASFPEIAARVKRLLDGTGSADLKAELLPDGQWDAFAFITACERVRQDGSLLREIQQVEFEALLEHLCQSGT